MNGEPKRPTQFSLREAARHVPATPEQTKAIDESLGLVLETFRLSKELSDRVTAVAKRAGAPRQLVLRQAVERFLSEAATPRGRPLRGTHHG